MSRRPPYSLGLAALLLASALSACSAPSTRSAAISRVTVTLEDFKLTTATLTLPAGPVRFDVTNDGPSTHEFNVDQTSLVDSELPIDTSGLFVNEKSPLLRRLGSVESAGLGTRHHLTLTLHPGQYVLYCNLEGHYLSGMHWTINVH